MASITYATKVYVRAAFDPETKLFALTSKELPGLLLAGHDISALHDDVPAVIKSLYKIGCGIDVTVTRLDDADDRVGALAGAEGRFVPTSREFVALPMAA